MVSKVKTLMKYCMVIFVALLIWGCNKSELDPLKISCNFQSEDLIGAFYTANGEALNFSLLVDKENSTSGLMMEQIEVFINNIKIAEVFNKERIDINYVLKKKTVGKNPLRVTMKATAPNYRETILHLNMNVNVFDNKPIYGFNLLAEEIWKQGEDTAMSIKEVDNATMNLTVNSVTFLVDDSIIGTTTAKESVLTYSINNLSIGNHILLALINCTTPDGQINTIISKSKQITVQ